MSPFPEGLDPALRFAVLACRYLVGAADLMENPIDGVYVDALLQTAILMNILWRLGRGHEGEEANETGKEKQKENEKEREEKKEKEEEGVCYSIRFPSNENLPDMKTVTIATWFQAVFSSLYSLGTCLMKWMGEEENYQLLGKTTTVEGMTTPNPRRVFNGSLFALLVQLGEESLEQEGTPVYARLLSLFQDDILAITAIATTSTTPTHTVPFTPILSETIKQGFTETYLLAKAVVYRGFKPNALRPLEADTTTATTSTTPTTPLPLATLMPTLSQQPQQPTPPTPSGVSDVLPIMAYRSQIIEHVKTNPVTVIQGETGCGKSSRVPQMLIEVPLRPATHKLSPVLRLATLHHTTLYHTTPHHTTSHHSASHHITPPQSEAHHENCFLVDKNVNYFKYFN